MIINTLTAAVETPVLPVKSKVWGWLVTALAALFLSFDGVIKLILIDPVIESMAELGFASAGLARGIGLLELACLVLYLVPRTAVLGAVLLTGFLGGAVAIHVRIDDPLFSHTLFPVYVGVLFWLGLWLRDRRVRGLFARA
jgi:hypothetical protein